MGTGPLQLPPSLDTRSKSVYHAIFPTGNGPAFALGASAAWHPGSPDPRELTHNFYRLFYGRGATGMDRLYQLMSTQAQFYASSWDSTPSATRPLMFGESYGIGPFMQQISTLPLPPVPDAGYLQLSRDWSNENIQLRGFSSPISVRNLANSVPDDVVDTLIKVCQENSPVFQRYFRLKARSSSEPR